MFYLIPLVTYTGLLSDAESENPDSGCISENEVQIRYKYENKV
jgi:hypothetical protein